MTCELPFFVADVKFVFDDDAASYASKPVLSLSETFATCFSGTFLGKTLGIGPLEMTVGFTAGFGNRPTIPLRERVVAVRAAPLTIPADSDDV